MAFGKKDGGGLDKRAVARLIERSILVKARPAEMRRVGLIVVTVDVVRVRAAEARAHEARNTARGQPFQHVRVVFLTL